MNNSHPTYAPQAAIFAKQYPQLEAASLHIDAPTCFDVLNGRGQGVQRHPGNVKYRTLVLLNKGLYAKCLKSDKAKISRGIVAAVRELGGRFLELDEQSGIYSDIGDKKAYEKTSQALREGQTKIRKQMYSEMSSSHNTPLLDRRPIAISSEGYFRYSVELLESLYKSEEMAASQSPPSRKISPCPSLGSEESNDC
ncbi:hypothetical protein ACHAXR_004201 [Thalassiosira sp. AJA248-18]